MGLPPTIQAASIGIPDTMLLMLLALVVFGPRRLPEIGRQIGKLMYEFRKVSNDFKFQMEEELRASEEAERQKKAQAQTPVLELNVPPQPVSEHTLELADGSSTAETVHPYSSPEPSFVTETTTVSADDGGAEMRGEPRKFPPVMPPSSGEVVAAAKPFRGRVPETVPETVAESAAETPAGDETHPSSVSGTEHEAHHA
jgi:sec-independent protein translocase protein TatB